MVTSPNLIEDLVSVVIANYNRCQDLREALSSVIAQDYSKVEVIVVDNGSQDTSLSMMAQEFPNVLVVALSENLGMDGYSVGFRVARGEYIFQMDNDSLIPDPGILSTIVQRFKEGPPNLAVLATRVEEYSPGSDIQELRRKDRRHGPINTRGFHSGGVGFRRRHLDQVGFYNRDVFLYASELFLQMKFLAAGYVIMYYPEILMLHKSSEEARSPLGLYYEIRNRYWFLRLFATPYQQIHFFPFMVFHDLAYALLHRAPYVFWQALRDGFSQLPESLKPCVKLRNPSIFAKVEEVGMQFCPASLMEHIHTHLRTVQFWACA
jgi:GT2 family glycosyltransferase